MVEHKFLEYYAAAADSVTESVVEEAERRYFDRCWHTAVVVEEGEGMRHGRQADVGLTVEEGRIDEKGSPGKEVVVDTLDLLQASTLYCCFHCALGWISLPGGG